MKKKKNITNVIRLCHKYRTTNIIYKHERYSIFVLLFQNRRKTLI